MTRSIRRLKGITTQTLLALTVLTAAKGVNNFMGHKETWYNLNMDKVIQRTDEALGATDLYHIREDGIKMYGPWVICAGHKSVPRYTLVETSKGTGIILDYHTVNEDKTLIDIATDW
jgi:hypothetical protein